MAHDPSDLHGLESLNVQQVMEQVRKRLGPADRGIQEQLAALSATADVFHAGVWPRGGLAALLGPIKNGLRRMLGRVLWRQVAYNQRNAAVLEQLERRITALARQLEASRPTSHGVRLDSRAKRDDDEPNVRRARAISETSRRLRVAFVVQRYGTEVCGGAELLCRQVAEHMTDRWDVEVLTTCATDYLTWQNVYPPGPGILNGVAVRRFPVDFPRHPARFAEISRRVFTGPHTLEDERRWMEAQGPHSTAFNEYVVAHQDDWDFVVFFTYLYALTFHGLPALGHKAALVPTAHDEPPIYLDLFRPIFAAPRLLVFLTPQEQTFVNRRFGTANVPQDVVSAGIDPPHDANAERFRQKHAALLGGQDFILYAGRIDPGKGCGVLLEHFIRFREEFSERPLRLVLIGAGPMEIPAHPDVVSLGFVSEQEKFDAIAASRLVVLPSPFESLSIVALEAWSLGKAVLANGTCDVLRDQCVRSDGGLWYENYAEFREALALLLDASGLRARLGASGRRFVERHCSWERVTARWAELVESAVEARGAPQALTRPS